MPRGKVVEGLDRDLDTHGVYCSKVYRDPDSLTPILLDHFLL